MARRGSQRTRLSCYPTCPPMLQSVKVVRFAQLCFLTSCERKVADSDTFTKGSQRVHVGSPSRHFWHGFYSCVFFIVQAGPCGSHLNWAHS